jgi:hypothetical protein
MRERIKEKKRTTRSERRSLGVCIGVSVVVHKERTLRGTTKVRHALYRVVMRVTLGAS